MRLISVEEALELDSVTIKQLLKEYVSEGLFNLFSFFSFSDDVPDFAEGCYITTKGGKKVLDITGGIGVLNHGHNHPEILQARINYANKRRLEVHKNYLSSLYVSLAHNMAQLCPGDLSISFFPSSGSEAVEGALKMAYKYSNPVANSPSHNILLHASESFHGKLFGAGSATGSPELNYRFPSPFKCEAFQRNSLHSFHEAFYKSFVDGKPNIFAVIYEPFSCSLCEGSSTSFLKEMRRLCTEFNVPLIFDEVYSGFFKTGPLFNFISHDVCPDIVTYGKSFGGGKASICGFTSTKKMYDKAYGSSKFATLHSTTYSGFGEEAVSALMAIEVATRDNYSQKAHELNDKLERILKELLAHSPIVKSISGEGALWAIELDPCKKLLTRLSSLKDYRLAQKLLTALVIERLYTDYNILSFFGSNTSVKLIVSLPLVANDSELKILKNSLFSLLVSPEGLNRLLVSKAFERLFGFIS